ncbi:uncharacterized protein BCR38DRAFT_426061 [Pseudomassariella vexata]|uniref:Uncharacterized protein n=1 Tax=Pseudomassariella vexata TaxID=1141098 RepID=A0A1Y2E6Y0_9PEZI|nr:uncharacterized protein BCR38DRAFT_426061 [Pseudomassariella vexata]ORY67094.1 hypothetical protein BCR38DRAFT_426061 [Pseudomassariella vexata]
MGLLLTLITVFEWQNATDDLVSDMHIFMLGMTLASGNDAPTQTVQTRLTNSAHHLPLRLVNIANTLVFISFTLLRCCVCCWGIRSSPDER